ncbi:MAG TPA: hypothetical protein VIL04_13565 [Solirubrobacterales bacterium]|jgi:hypothetical protein
MSDGVTDSTHDRLPAALTLLGVLLIAVGAGLIAADISTVQAQQIVAGAGSADTGPLGLGAQLPSSAVAADAGGSDGLLPFTGAAALPMIAVGLIAVASGLALRRRTER